LQFQNQHTIVILLPKKLEPIWVSETTTAFITICSYKAINLFMILSS